MLMKEKWLFNVIKVKCNSLRHHESDGNVRTIREADKSIYDYLLRVTKESGLFD